MPNFDMKTLFHVSCDVERTEYMSNDSTSKPAQHIVWARSEEDARELVYLHYKGLSSAYAITYFPRNIEVNVALGTPD